MMISLGKGGEGRYAGGSRENRHENGGFKAEYSTGAGLNEERRRRKDKREVKRKKKKEKKK